MFIFLRALFLVLFSHPVHPLSEESYLHSWFQPLLYTDDTKCMSQPRCLSCTFPISFSESASGMVHWDLLWKLTFNVPIRGQALILHFFCFLPMGSYAHQHDPISLSQTSLHFAEAKPPWWVRCSQRPCAPDCSWSAGSVGAKSWQLYEEPKDTQFSQMGRIV